MCTLPIAFAVSLSQVRMHYGWPGRPLKNFPATSRGVPAGKPGKAILVIMTASSCGRLGHKAEAYTLDQGGDAAGDRRCSRRWSGVAGPREIGTAVSWYRSRRAFP